MKALAPDLPRELGDGLVLRRAVQRHMDELAAFNVEMHSDDPAAPDAFLGHWTRDLLGGSHPTAEPGDFTVVVDEAAGGRIVSCCCLISQTWAYEDVEFGCGRMELVTTHPDYRRRGLVREQLRWLHARSARKGERVQAITGIPWFYRQFGYEMALELGGGRLYLWHRPGNLRQVEEEDYTWRKATPDDVPALAHLYRVHCAASMVSRVRSQPEWAYHIDGAHEESPQRCDFRVVTDREGAVVAYAELRPRGPYFAVRELSVREGHPWRPVIEFMTRVLKAEADERAEQGEKKIEAIYFRLGVAHPVYEALGTQLESPWPPYAWYVRVADLPGFLRHVAPVLERRLAGTVMAGHTGTLRVSTYVEHRTLEFRDGRLVEIGTYDPQRLGDADVLFPDHTFLKLVFGYRSLEELRAERADCYATSAEAQVLLGSLFPRRASQPVALG